MTYISTIAPTHSPCSPMDHASMILQLGLKPARGTVLQDELTDRAATHTALDCSHNPLVAAMGNFLHKAHYSALPLKNTRHWLYWYKATNSTSAPRSPLAAAHKDRNRLTKWVARQKQFDTQLCTFCPTGTRETAPHMLGGECTLHLAKDLNTGHKVCNLICMQATTCKAYIDHIPLWFPNRGEPDSATLHSMEAFKSLVAYNKFMGRLGYMPSCLCKALECFGIPDRGVLICEIAVCVAKAARDKWKA